VHPDDAVLADRLHEAGGRIRAELAKRIVGQDEVVELALVALFAGGNCLLVGVPGLAKTLLIHSMAQALDLSFNRIQFTPDLMPSDVTGTDVIQDDPATGQRRLAFLPGPISPTSSSPTRSTGPRPRRSRPSSRRCRSGA